jgi:hypothetical protein
MADKPTRALPPHFRGKGRGMRNPAVWTPDEDFEFGGKTFRAGVPVKQFESANFGYTVQDHGAGAARAVILFTTVIGKE